MARPASQSATLDRPTPLERIALDALAWELGPTSAGLGALLADTRIARRFETGSGFVNTLVDQSASRTRTRTRGPTGLFGSVHLMVDGLPEAVGFQLQLKSGQPISLIADAYDLDTHGFDLSRAAVKDVFYIDAQGRSRPVPQQRPEPKAKSTYSPKPSRPAVPVAALIENAAAWTPPTLRQIDGGKESTWSAGIETPPPAVNRDTVRVVVWAVVAFLGVILGLAGLPWVFVGIGMFMAGRALTRPPVLDRIAEAFGDQQWFTGRSG